ncbi:MAG: putative cobaltochelatase [Candidatus Neomarinimicrobiota bacterium]|nr:MAG: putative cobaltochelatase [Candidatus Neomarinimicrobiota bacterium]
MHQRDRLIYPFSAIVGQEKMKKGLLLNAINPKIGGILLRGEKGTAKSIAVRALTHLLPQIEVVADCPFHCNPHDENNLCDICAMRIAKGEKLSVSTRQIPFVELPIGATEDRVVGTLDIERAIKTGKKHFEPGLLAAANRGILYIDEVNLLDDHLVDVLLDAAAMGVNYVEREGISFSHPAQFILVGTMNPEEGELRPQLLDRFGLAVDIKGIPDQEDRAKIVRQRVAFEKNPLSFIAAWEDEQKRLREQIEKAKKLLPKVHLGEEMLKLITQICIDFGVDGHRADIVMYKTAVTLAAYYGRDEVCKEDVKEAAELALLHRRRRQPFQEPKLNQEQIEKSIQKWQEDKSSQGQSQNEENQSQEKQKEKPDISPDNDAPSGTPFSGKDSGDLPDEGEKSGKERVFQAELLYQVKRIAAPVSDQVFRSQTGRRSKSRTNSKTGRYVDSLIPRGKITDLAFDATLRAAAPFQVGRKKESSSQNALIIKKYDLREKVREKKIGNLIMFILDASGSMAAEERMVATKEAVLSLLLDAYQRRDQVGMVVFRGEKAELVLPFTNSVELAQKQLSELPTGGRTPLAHGLKLGLDTVKKHLRKDKYAVPLLVLVSDGRANVSFDDDDPVEEAKKVAREIKVANIKSIAIDTEQGFITFGLVRQICSELGGIYLRLEELKSGPRVSAVQKSLGYREKNEMVDEDGKRN